MGWTKVGTETLDGRSYDILVQPNGVWVVTTEDGNELTAETKIKLLDKLKRFRRTSGKIAIPVTFISIGSWRGDRDKFIVTKAIVTGLHARNRSILYTDARGKKHTDGDFAEAYCDLTPEQIQDVIKIRRTLVDAEKAWEHWKQVHKVSVPDLIEQAHTESAPEPTPEIEETT